MGLSRADLRAMLPTGSEQTVDKIMEAYGSEMKNYVKAEDAEKRVQDAINGFDVTKSDAYKKLSDEFAGYKNKIAEINGPDYSGVKSKFREDVYSRIDHGDKHKEIKEQMDGLRTAYPEFFDNEASHAPVGTAPAGAAPEGKKIADVTSYYRKKYGERK